MLNTRIKSARKELKLTQTEFGKRIGVSDGAISLLEKGERNLTGQMRLAICREFGINQHWLLTGEGEAFSVSNSKIDKVLDSILIGEKETAKAVIKALAKMGGEEWDLFEEIILSVAHEIEEAKNGPK